MGRVKAIVRGRTWWSKVVAPIGRGLLLLAAVVLKIVDSSLSPLNHTDGFLKFRITLADGTHLLHRCYSS